MSDTALIFYGAGAEAKSKLSTWIKEGYIPACFADADENKHHTKICGIDILPLHEAEECYPDYNIFIAVSEQKYEMIFKFLLDKGIAHNKIIFPKQVYYGLGCHDIGRRFAIFDNIKTCCFDWANTPKTCGTDVLASDYENYKALCGLLINEIRNDQKTTCDGCPKLKIGIYSLQPELDCISPSTVNGVDFCNCRCVYCLSSVQERPSDAHNAMRRQYVLDMIDLSASRIPPIHIDYAFGEISVAPFCDEVMHYAADRNVEIQVYTNAIIFKESIAHLINTTTSWVFCSLDAGTADSYAKMKRVNRFERVVANLKKYSGYGRVILKFVMVDGINDNEDDVNGFLDIAKTINAEVLLSFDLHKSNQRLPEKMLCLSKCFLDQTKSRELTFIENYDFYNTEDAQILQQYGADIGLWYKSDK